MDVNSSSNGHPVLLPEPDRLLGSVIDEMFNHLDNKVPIDLLDNLFHLKALPTKRYLNRQQPQQRPTPPPPTSHQSLDAATHQSQMVKDNVDAAELLNLKKTIFGSRVNWGMRAFQFETDQEIFSRFIIQLISSDMISHRTTALHIQLYKHRGADLPPSDIISLFILFYFL